MVMLSTVILTRNEEKNIEQAVQSVSFSDEIIVLDDNSTDETVQIATKLGCKVLKRALEGDFAGQRNYAMEQAKGDWILFLDSDEEVTPHLKSEIMNLLKKDSHHELFFIKRQDEFWGKKLRHGELEKATNTGFIRLVKKGSGVWKNKVHEEFVTASPVGRLNNFIHHKPHKNITEFIESVNYYSTIKARELYDEGKRTNILEIIFLPFFKFNYTYIMKAGFLDGPAGFVYSFLMSFHSFLVRAKLYQYEHIKS